MYECVYDVHVCAYLYQKRGEEQFVLGGVACAHSDQGPLDLDLRVLKDFWELALRSGASAAWEIMGTGENRLGGHGSSRMLAAWVTPPSLSFGNGHEHRARTLALRTVPSSASAGPQPLFPQSGVPPPASLLVYSLWPAVSRLPRAGNCS